MLVKIGELLGWLVVISFVFAGMILLVKFINKNYMNKISNSLKGKKNYFDLYKKTVGFIVKKHKVFGLIATVVVFLHMAIMWKNVELSITGMIALILMFSVTLLGITSTYVKKEKKALFTKLHSTLAFALLAAIIIHLL